MNEDDDSDQTPVLVKEIRKEIRGIHEQMTLMVIMFMIMLGLMFYVFFHLTRLVIAP